MALPVESETQILHHLEWTCCFYCWELSQNSEQSVDPQRILPPKNFPDATAWGCLSILGCRDGDVLTHVPIVLRCENLLCEPPQRFLRALIEVTLSNGAASNERLGHRSNLAEFVIEKNDFSESGRSDNLWKKVTAVAL